jgi:hypothetical protein
MPEVQRQAVDQEKARGKNGQVVPRKLAWPVVLSRFNKKPIVPPSQKMSLPGF